MNCIQCGEPLAEGTLNCPHCGTEQVEISFDDHLVVYEGEDQEITDLKNYLGTETRFYFKKWGIESGEVKTVSWNWAAFFLSYFWAGYRKMYRYIFILFGIYLGIDLIGYFFNLDIDRISVSIGIMTSVIFGIYGNYFYYLDAKRKINKIKSSSMNPESELRKKGGTSGIGVLISVGILILYMVINVVLYGLLYPSETIEFGYGEVDAEIVNASTEFSPSDEIYYSFYFPDLVGGEFTIMIEKIEDGVAIVYDSWDDEIPLEWGGLTSSMYAPYEPGEYRMSVIKNDEVVAEGSFIILDDLDWGEEI